MEKSFAFDNEAKVKKGVVHVGKQSSNNSDSVWVLSPKIHIDSKGQLLSVSSFAWQPIGGPQIELTFGGSRQTASFELQSDICLPLESTIPLKNLLTSMRQTLKHNFLSGK